MAIELTRTTDDLFWESHRLVSPDNASMQQFQNKIQSIAERLIPWHDFEAEPIDFLISDTKNINAWFLASNNAGNDKHTIGFTKGILDFFENEDQLAFVLAHELGHFGFLKDLGKGSNSLAEERGADTKAAIKWMIDAGYNPEEGRKVIEGFADKKYSTDKELARAFDVHGSIQTRIEDTKAEISIQLGKKGTLVSQAITPMTDRETYRNASHLSYLDELKQQANFHLLSNQQKRDFLLDVAPEIKMLGSSNESGISNVRVNEYRASLKESFSIHERYIKGEAFEKIPKVFMEQDYPATISVLDTFRDLNFGKLQPVGHLKTATEAIFNFMEASSEDAARVAAETFLTEISKSYNQVDNSDLNKSLSYYFEFPKFELPDESGVGEPVPWNQMVEWAQKDVKIHYILTEVLGVKDKRLKAENHRDFPRNLRLSYPKGPNGEVYDNYLIGEDGTILATNTSDIDAARELEKQQNLVKERTEILSKWRNEKSDHAGKVKMAYQRIKANEYESFEEFLEDAEYVAGQRQRYLKERKLFQSSEFPYDGMVEEPKVNLLTLDQQYKIERQRNQKDKDGNVKLNRNGVALKYIAHSQETILAPISALLFDRFLEHLEARIKQWDARDNANEAITERNHLHSLVFERKTYSKTNLIRPVTIAQHKALYAMIERQRDFFFFGNNPENYNAIIINIINESVFDKDNILDVEAAQLEKHLKQTIKADYNFPEYQPYIIEQLRSFYEYEAPQKSKDLLKLYKKAQQLSTELFSMETAHYLSNIKNQDFDILNTLKPFFRDTTFLGRTNTLFRTSLIPVMLDDFMNRNNAWPKETHKLIETYKFLEKNNLFAPGGTAQQALLTRAAKQVLSENNPLDRIAAIEHMLSGEPIFDGSIRSRLTQQWVNDISQRYGIDDGTQAYMGMITVDVNRIKDSEINLMDKATMFRNLSDEVVSQKELSYELSKTAVITRELLVKESKKGHAAEAMSVLMTNDRAMCEHSVDFLTSPLTQNNTRAFIIELTHRQKAMPFGEKKSASEAQKKAIFHSLINEHSVGAMHRNFWNQGIEARAYFTNRILSSYAKSVKFNDRNDYREEWQIQLELVEQKVLIGDDDNTTGVAKKTLHAYTNALNDSQRSYFLSAILMASQSKENEQKNAMEVVGEGLAAFFEMMGPAEIKLGQAVHSNTGTPDEMRQGMGKLKGNAAPPALWEVDDWIEQFVPEELTHQIKRRGKVLGSGSYFVAVEVELQNGEHTVLRLLRPNARERAELGFQRLMETAQALQESEKSTVLNRLFQSHQDAIGSALSKMVGQAQKMSATETDMTIGAQQLEKAHELYDGTTVEVDGYKFDFKVTPWQAYGTNYAMMQKAPGKSFNQLPESNEEAQVFKKAAAKANITVELLNVLKGGSFDHDRHGEQQNIDRSGNNATIWLYDQGAMSLDKPKLMDKIQLADMLYGAVTAAMDGKDIGNKMLHSIGNKEKWGVDTAYLVEVQKSALALQDFVEYQKEIKNKDGHVIQQKQSLSEADMKQIFSTVLQSPDLDPVIANTFKAKIFQRMNFKSFSNIREVEGDENLRLTQHNVQTPKAAKLIDKKDEKNRYKQVYYVIDKRYAEAGAALRKAVDVESTIGDEVAIASAPKSRIEEKIRKIILDRKPSSTSSHVIKYTASKMQNDSNNPEFNSL